LQIIREISIGLSGTGGEQELGDDGQPKIKPDVDPFEEQFGWLIHAERFAEHYRISLNEAFELPCREFVNSLVYLNGKAGWNVRRNKKVND
jgi:hypothetical protein